MWRQREITDPDWVLFWHPPWALLLCISTDNRGTCSSCGISSDSYSKGKRKRSEMQGACIHTVGILRFRAVQHRIRLSFLSIHLCHQHMCRAAGQWFVLRAPHSAVRVTTVWCSTTAALRPCCPAQLCQQSALPCCWAAEPSDFLSGDWDCSGDSLLILEKLQDWVL